MMNLYILCLGRRIGQLPLEAPQSYGLSYAVENSAGGIIVSAFLDWLYSLLLSSAIRSCIVGLIILLGYTFFHIVAAIWWLLSGREGKDPLSGQMSQEMECLLVSLIFFSPLFLVLVYAMIHVVVLFPIDLFTAPVSPS